MPALSKILLRLPKDLHDAVKVRAAEADLSVNALLERYIAQGVTSSLNDDVSEKIINQAQKEFGSNCIGLLLFGSRARGDAHDTSDTDLLLVVENEVRIERSLYRRWDTTLPDGISLNITHLPVTPREAGSLWLECALDAKILFDPSRRISKALSALKEYITSGHVVRRITHGQGFWVPQ
jgi:predicted nucleotidyltransferase